MVADGKWNEEGIKLQTSLQSDDTNKSPLRQNSQ